MRFLRWDVGGNFATLTIWSLSVVSGIICLPPGQRLAVGYRNPFCKSRVPQDSISCGTRDSRLSMAGSQAGLGPAVLDLRTVFDPGSPATLRANRLAECSCMSQRRTNESSGRVRSDPRLGLTGHEHHDVTGADRQSMPGWFIRPVRCYGSGSQTARRPAPRPPG